MKRERVEDIAEILDKRGKMTLEQLEEVFPNVSQMTLRRDLLQLEEDGRIIRIRGGAMSVKEVQKVSGEEYTKKTTINTDAKIVIAQKVANLIDEGACIFLDGGTTAMYLSKEMPDLKCNIFTNGIAVAMELAQKKNVAITVVGGQLMKDNLSLPPLRQRHISTRPISKLQLCRLRRSPPTTVFRAIHRLKPSF